MKDSKKMINTIQSNAGAALTSGGSITIGLSTFFQIIPPCLGAIASTAAIILTTVLIINTKRKARLEQELLRLQIKEIKKNK